MKENFLYGEDQVVSIAETLEEELLREEEPPREEAQLRGEKTLRADESLKDEVMLREKESLKEEEPPREEVLLRGEETLRLDQSLREEATLKEKLLGEEGELKEEALKQEEPLGEEESLKGEGLLREEELLRGEESLRAEESLREEELLKEEVASTQEITLEDQHALRKIRKNNIEWDIKKIGRAMLSNLAISVVFVWISMFIIGIVFGTDEILSEQGYGNGGIIMAFNTLLTMLVANTLPFMRCAKQIQVNSKALFKKVTMTKQEMLTSFLAVLGLNAIGTTIYLVLDWGLGYFNRSLKIDEIFIFDRLGIETIIWGICVIIVAPITEEYIFRGVLLNGLKRYGERFAIISTSVLFGLIHGNLYQGISVTLFAMLLAYITIKKESILPAIGLHMANNLFSVVISILITNTGEVGGIINGISWIVLCVVGIIILIKNRTVYRTITNDEKYKGLRLKAICKSICLWLVVLLYLYTIATTIVPV